MLKILVFSDVTLCRRTKVLVGLENPMLPALFEISDDAKPVTEIRNQKDVNLAVYCQLLLSGAS
jgi:hypothetical protein